MFYCENFGENDDEETPNSEVYSQAVKSQIDEEYATEAPSSSLGKDEIKESNLSEKKKRSVARLQLQAISQLSPGVNKLTDKNAK